MRFIQAMPSGDTEAPSAPAGLTAVAVTETTVDLSWTVSTDNTGVTGYDIYNGSTVVGSVNGTTTTFTVTNLTAGTSYTFTVKAKDAAGNSSAANTPLSVTTTIAPSSPNLLLNGGFETYTGSGGVADNWIKSFTAGVTQAFQTVNNPVFEGVQAQKLSGSGLASGDNVKIHQITAIEPNVPYTVSGQFNVDSLTAAKVQLYVDFLDASNAIVGTARAEQLSPTTGYITLEKSGVTPIAAAKAKVYAILRGTGAGGTGSFEVDAMSFTQSPADPQAFNAPHGAAASYVIFRPFWRMPAAFGDNGVSTPFAGWLLGSTHT
ncbi:fibronectin type III domain-containing protein [Paenibacillus oenotherae]|uniref:Fibronectin type III domain-containing protein n=2 Tax=Paenibacillus oenotherae TaxID=1435645 RepID=A0ABS7D354_9BACL|nr:fibronectin type III domain-containing protein [Paenibacillus oenotherae]